MRRVLAITLACLLLFAGRALAETTIKLGLVTKPGSAQNICADKFKELLEARSQGRYRVKVYHSASLGTETEILQQIQLNTVQMGIITLGPFDVFVPEVKVVTFPFMFKSNEQVDRVLDGPPGQALLQGLEKAGFKGLAFSENGFRNLTNDRHPVHRAAEVAGLKIRVMESNFHKELWRTLGANPTPMGWPIYTELQQGTIDGQENPLWVIWTYKLFEVQKYMTLTGHVYSAHIDVANLEWFHGLPASDQEMIRRAMVDAARYQRAWNRENEADFLARLKEAGMEVDEDPDLESFKAKVAGMQEMEMYQEPATRRLLKMFLEATR